MSASPQENSSIYPGAHPHGHTMSSSSLGNFQPAHAASQSMYLQTNNSARRVSSRPMSMRSVDMSSIYQGSGGEVDSSATNAAFDLSQGYISSYLGDNNQSLMPRMKTIELYRKNAKKSNDPQIQFQFAQYMLQTALMAKAQLAMIQQQQKNQDQPLAADALGLGANYTSVRTPSMYQVGSSSELDQLDQLSINPPNVNLGGAGNRQSNGSSLNVNSRPGTPTDSNANNRKSSYLNIQPISNDSVALDDQKVILGLLREAVHNLRKLSDKGFAEAQYLLGDAYSSGVLGKKDMKESFSLFHQAAKHGHAESCYRVALCFEEGWGTSKDPKKCVQFLRKASSQNHPSAMFRLALIMYNGHMGFRKITTVQQEGIKWLTRASEVANKLTAAAPYQLAKIYETGYKDIVIQDYSYSVQLYVQSAGLGYIPAAGRLGKCYELGLLNCPQDPPLSVHYYTIAALGGDAESMMAMCAWYLVGADPILPQNEEEAFEWAKRSAMKGFPKACYAVGHFLENGIGTDRDMVEATKWFTKAVEAGDERAIKRQQKIEGLNSGKAKTKKNRKKGSGCIIM